MKQLMKQYKAKTNLRINGKEYPLGSTVELSDADADRMSAVVEAIEEQTTTEVSEVQEVDAQPEDTKEAKKPKSKTSKK